MKIGIIGTGQMGRALGVRWARAGHQVLFGSRDAAKARAVALGCSAESGDLDAAAAFGDAVLYTVRDVLPSSELRRPRALAGKILIDCNNTAVLGLDVPDPERRPGFHFVAAVPSLAERIAVDVPWARVVKAFNTVPSRVIELEQERLRRARVSIFVCSDDAEAKAAVTSLAEDLGFIGVDAGGLAQAGMIETVADAVRFQIVVQGRSLMTALSLRDLEP
ncbi:MAG: NADPH-dependent F420 reductase [Myxococcales bacterium]